MKYVFFSLLSVMIVAILSGLPLPSCADIPDASELSKIREKDGESGYAQSKKRYLKDIENQLRSTYHGEIWTDSAGLSLDLKKILTAKHYLVEVSPQSGGWRVAVDLP